MLKSLFHKNYLLYGSTLIFTRGLEYLVLLFAAGFLVKEEYGELEFYKKVIEVGASIVAFGFPALILSYTRSLKSKTNFLALSSFSVLIIAIISLPFLFFAHWTFLLIPFIFYALFFNGGVLQAYLLVKKGSNYVSFYKIIVSVLFYAIVFLYVFFIKEGKGAYVYVNYILFPILLTYLIIELFREKTSRKELKKYWTLFKKLLYGSFTLVVSNFANLMFLYTDIFVIKTISKTPSLEIADYSFALNIAGALLIIPLTFVQVDIEKIKENFKYVNTLNKKLILSIFLGSIFIAGAYLTITNWFLIEYKNTLTIFLIILLAKIVQSFSPAYGTLLVIKKQFNTNLVINLSTLLLNIILSFTFYKTFSLIGIAWASVVSIVIRQILLVYFNTKQTK